MPSARVRAFVAAMKLRELKQGRDRLSAAYDEIELRTQAASSPAEALRHMVTGLRELTIANKPIHPELGL